ncbi:DUF7446 family protein [Morganella morganii]|uniref:DUF7446 family protein n=1 Tax=Morganella morganii TaxID=582 RepID=UPI00128D02AC|nr:hypothetical protein [Morganella morganii]MQC08044.1 hypothetical protein [Morganella morganii]MQC10101.1 hypothetical protein [Morganella morganii]MQC13234.1 hypothetical protein [Morganella morganii]
MTNKVSLQLGYSPLTKTIKLAKMKDMPNGVRMRVGNTSPRDVTNEAAQMVWQLVIDEGGVIQWKREDGNIMRLSAELINGDDNEQIS